MLYVFLTSCMLIAPLNFPFIYIFSFGSCDQALCGLFWHWRRRCTSISLASMHGYIWFWLWYSLSHPLLWPISLKEFFGNFSFWNTLATWVHLHTDVYIHMYTLKKKKKMFCNFNWELLLWLYSLSPPPPTLLLLAYQKTYFFFSGFFFQHHLLSSMTSLLISLVSSLEKPH